MPASMTALPMPTDATGSVNASARQPRRPGTARFLPYSLSCPVRVYAEMFVTA